jgi:UDP-N-acetylglucosamine/UDP-N-acetylgalactosamine diphosphorylase
MIELNIEKARKLLAAHGQEHLLRFWPRLAQQQRRGLLAQIGELDLAKVDDWVEKIVSSAGPSGTQGKIEAPDYYKAQPQDERQERLYKKARGIGAEAICEGSVAAFVVAGGQGTRLGFDGPKGDYHISPVRNKTLFQLFAEQIRAASKKYAVSLPWYIMASPLNYQATCEIFEANDFYGLPENDVFIFQQGTLPNFSPDGRILLADVATISCSPDGHGGSIKALYNSGAIEDMKKRGIEYISYFQVDNPLINIFDPLFVGLHVLDESQMSSKAVLKTGPKERVGNFCKVDGRVTVIEYSDLPDELAEARNPDGSYVFELGSIAIHIISRGFVEQLNTKGFALPLHRAIKEIPYVDADGRHVEPAEPNGIKLESFVFDALPLAKNSVILQIRREQEFAPVKNATGIDSVETARQMMIARWAGWLEAAGAVVPRKADGTVDAKIEIAHSFATEPDELKDKAEAIPRLKPGGSIYLE